MTDVPNLSELLDVEPPLLEGDSYLDDPIDPTA